MRTRSPHKTTLQALVLTSLATLLLSISLPALAANENCADCQNALPPGLGHLAGLAAEDTFNDARNVAWMMGPNSRLQGGILGRTQSELQALQLDPVTGQKVWNGVGEIPNRFQPTWDVSTRSPDPGFVTPFYNEREGVLPVASNPMFQTLGPRLGQAFFDMAQGGSPRGMLFFAGRF
ncbi:MAG: hypothetical protein NDJ90_06650 [Oligoflexia bacterium]|nr:hypothetical protein [Oligoflexia bacterium]